MDRGLSPQKQACSDLKISDVSPTRDQFQRNLINKDRLYATTSLDASNRDIFE